MDNSLKTKEKPPKRGANAPPRKGETKTFLIGKELKTNTLRHTAGDTGKRRDNKTQPKPPDSLRQGAARGYTFTVPGPKWESWIEGVAAK